jgi:TRAP-type uncharacterized transport system fused permease subunit
VIALNAALEGYFLIRLDMVRRGLLLVAGLLLIVPEHMTSIAGATCFIAITAWLWSSRRALRLSPVPSPA